MNLKFREPFSGFSHLIGAFLSFIGFLIMIYSQVINKSCTVVSLTGAMVFCTSMILLYSASGIYHLVNASTSIINILRKIDHSMIFVLIAGTYTPICLSLLKSPLQNYMIIIIWSLAIVGIFFKTFWINCPSWLSSGIYILMGWIAIFFFKPMSSNVEASGLFLLVLGGIIYTIGGIIYCLEKRNKKRTFGAHEIFHLFVIAGSIMHYIFIYKYVFML